GRTRIVGGRPLYLAVQTAEKVPHVVSLVARGPGGHASIPLVGNAILRLGRGLVALGRHAEPVQLTPTTRGFFGALSRVWPSPVEREAMAAIAGDDMERAARGAVTLAEVSTFGAILRNGIS